MQTKDMLIKVRPVGGELAARVSWISFHQLNLKELKDPAYSIHRVDDQDVVNGDLCVALRPFLRWGRLLGILPVNGLFTRNAGTDSLRCTKFGVAWWWNKVIVTLLVVNCCVGVGNMILATKETASELALSCSMAIFYFMGSATYFYFGTRCSQFVLLLRSWKDLKALGFEEIGGYVADVHLSRDTNLVAALIFTSGILENLVLLYLHAQVLSIPYDENVREMGAPRMDAYYRNSHREWVRVVYDGSDSPTATFLGVLLCFCNKFAVYAWNYADALIVILSRALHFKFKRLRDVAEAQLLTSKGGEGGGEMMSVSGCRWSQLTKDHAALCNLLAEFARFLSPLVFMCFATNIFYICLQIKLGLTSMNRTNFLSSFYFGWSLLHLVGRFLLVCVSAARVNDHALSVPNLYRSCPDTAYSLTVERAEATLNSRSVGLDGLGCFVVTKPFILTVVGVVFTFEIVLLTTK